jgi:hypothetical protein
MTVEMMIVITTGTIEMIIETIDMIIRIIGMTGMTTERTETVINAADLVFNIFKIRKGV